VSTKRSVQVEVVPADADPVLASHLDLCADAILQALPAPGSVAAEVTASIARALLAGETPRVDRIARRMGLTTRTLHRRLSQEGSSYRDLRRDGQCKHAQELLRRESAPIDAIAARAGFSDASTFTRAFRLWTGQTPQAYRRGCRG
jgi:AraC-like DNA-binding protein